jgi:hypothetical protein
MQIGVDFGGTKIEVAALDRSGEFVRAKSSSSRRALTLRTRAPSWTTTSIARPAYAARHGCGRSELVPAEIVELHRRLMAWVRESAFPLWSRKERIAFMADFTSASISTHGL